MRRSIIAALTLFIALLHESGVAEPIELTALGFVVVPERIASASAHAKRCQQMDGCFALRLEHAIKLHKENDVVLIRFDKNTRFIDPELYELPLKQVKLAAGKHLRVTFHVDADNKAALAYASVVRIGD